jgi:hypothetical protein
MMKELRLPGPEYIHDVAAWDSFTTKVVFFPSIQFMRASEEPYSLYGYPAMTLEAAKRDAARQAITYMEQSEKKVPSGFADAAFEEEKKRAEFLRHELEKNKEKLIRKSNQLIQTAAACDEYIDIVTESNRRIKDIILKTLTPGCTTPPHQCQSSLLEIQNIAISLSQHTAKTIAMVRAAGPSPFGEDTFHNDRLSSSGNSDFSSTRFAPPEYDSDGRPTDYSV